MTVLSRAFVELWTVISPVRRAVTAGPDLARFLERFGYRLEPAVWDAAVSDVDDLANAISAFADELGDVDDFTDLSEAEIASLTAAASVVFAEVRALAGAGGHIGGLGLSHALFEEVFDALLHDYLAVRAPFLLEVFGALETVVYEDVPASGPGGRQVHFVRIRFDWDRLGAFISDTGAWAEEIYGWGTDFQYAKALVRLARISDMIGPASHFEDIPVPIRDAFLKNIPPPSNPAFGDRHDLLQLRFPLWGEEVAIPGIEGASAISGEVGVTLLPFGDLNARNSMGLALSPYADGNVDVTHSISDNLDLLLDVEGSAVGGRFVVMRPSGITVEGGGAVDVGFELGIEYAKADGSEITIIGSPDATRLATNGALIALGGNLDGDLFLAGGVKALTLHVDVSSDGFLGVVIPEPIVIEAGDILMGWRPGRGVYFEGGTGISVTVPLNVDLELIELTEIGLRLDWADDLQVTFHVSGSATLGPLFASVEELGLVITLVKAPGGDGVFGKYDLAFGIKPPSGYAVALDSPVISGGGYLSVNGYEYRGALALEFQSFGISAFAILATKLPDGRDGFSFVASIFGSFALPLPFGFFLTGVGGIIGVNRTTNTDALRAVLFEGRFDNLLFPNDPIANAATILEDMAAIFPAQEGQYLFGPIARIGWGQPVLIEVTLGVVLEVGQFTKLLVLGGLASELPTKDAALVVLKLSFFGEIDIAAGKISFDATIQGSRILTWPVSGDAAIRTGWGVGIEHIASFGGLHPQYPRPANLPDLRRISVNFGTNNPKVTLSGYAAVTLNSLQFGARADLYAKGPKIWLVGQVAAEGWVYFDALIIFNPFGFDISLGGGLQLLVDGDVEAGLGFDLNLKGPNPFKIKGKVWVTVFGIDVDFPISHTWGNAQSLPPATADPAVVLLQAIEASRGFEPLPAAGLLDAVIFADDDATNAAINAAGGARLAQRAVPLAIRIDKVGEAQIVGGGATMDLKVYALSGTEVPLAATRLDFVRGHFWKISDADKLRAPVFEQHKAGFDVSAGGLVANTGAAITATYEYEVIRIASEDDRLQYASILKHATLSPAFIDKWMYVNQKLVAEPHFGLRPPSPVDAVKVRETAYVTTDVLQAATTTATGVESAYDVMHQTIDEQHITLTGSMYDAMGQTVEKITAGNMVVADYVAAGGMGR